MNIDIKILKAKLFGLEALCVKIKKKISKSPQSEHCWLLQDKRIVVREIRELNIAIGFLSNIPYRKVEQNSKRPNIKNIEKILVGRVVKIPGPHVFMGRVLNGLRATHITEQNVRMLLEKYFGTYSCF